MALRRMVPTNFFKDPDIINLSSKDSQLILIGLILAADDEGRGVAHAQILGREMDYPPETIEQALQDLAANDLLTLYRAGRHRYYSLPRWHKWQTINRNRMTPSKYPAPSPVTTEATTATDAPQASADDAGNLHADSGEKHGGAGKMHADSGERPVQWNLIESNPRESNSMQSNEVEGDGGEPEAQPPPNVVIFPTLTPSCGSDDGNDDKKVNKWERDTLNQLARILRLPPDEALLRIVQDYRASPALSLLGEADAAIEWIDDPKRNKQHKQMTPAFFRRWLQREQESRQRQAATLATTPISQQQSRTANGGASPPLHRGISPGSGLAGRSLMDLEHRYKASRDSPLSNTRQTKREAKEGGQA